MLLFTRMCRLLAECALRPGYVFRPKKERDRDTETKRETQRQSHRKRQRHKYRQRKIKLAEGRATKMKAF